MLRPPGNADLPIGIGAGLGLFVQESRLTRRRRPLALFRTIGPARPCAAGDKLALFRTIGPRGPEAAGLSPIRNPKSEIRNSSATLLMTLASAFQS
jgi:hypothetical protein